MFVFSQRKIKIMINVVLYVSCEKKLNTRLNVHIETGCYI